ncbi:Disease resistance protein RPM1 [Panicum miliaceum]|uniref:Disease resistance protein RPM1 n=1 Tax=Panicum miliaceum TaxID=4540 RepID=A0A3L6T8F5_PANMI|nr:Disease resistance protein RPM1 [Panicum miliaceum]
MAALVVSAATGALKPLLEKLATELCREYKQFKGVPDEIKSLTKELGAMEAYLQKMSELEDPDAQDKDCMKEVRELSYDMEDIVDEFLLRVAGGGEAADDPGGLIARLKNAVIAKPRTRRKIAKVIEDLKAQVKEMGERNARYKAHETVSKASNAGVDGRALAMFEEASKIVGLDGPRNELVEVSRKKNGSAPTQPAKVLSIVGCGAWNKQTLTIKINDFLKDKSMFPEDHIIDKKHLVRRWVAEGFIPTEQGQTLHELGERCFNELINRSLIQARNISMYGEVTACQVHDTILDFIVSKSEEENFITVCRDDSQMPGSGSKVRRLSLHACSKAKASTLTELNLAHVRSVTVFAYSEELPSWSKLSFLRVLDLKGCKQVESGHLGGIGNLFQLKYLSLRETGVSELPEQIWKLKSLETLDLKKSKVKKLPAGISLLTRLVYLAVDKGVKIPDGTERMKALEDLDCVDVFKQSVNFPREFGQLENLRNVWLFLSSGNRSAPAEGIRYKEYLSIMASSLCKLGRLRSFSVEVDPESSEDFCLDSGGDVIPASLRRFQVTGHFLSKVPNWVPSLVNLQCLTLHVKELEAQDLMALGRLPILVFLRLVAQESFQGTRVAISGADGFQRLRQFHYGCATPIRFEAGAMPEIKKLILMFNYFKASWAVRNNTDFFLYPVGIQHLASLDSVCCLLYYEVQEVLDWIAEKRTQMAGMSCEQVKATVGEMDATVQQMFKPESLMETAARAHLKCSELTIRRTTQWGMRNKDMVEFIVNRMASMFGGRLASRTLAEIKRQVREMMSNCPLKVIANVKVFLRQWSS